MPTPTDSTPNAASGDSPSRAAPGDDSLHGELGDGWLHAEPGDGSLHAEPGDGSLHAEPGDGSLHAEPGDGALRMQAAAAPGSPPAPLADASLAIEGIHCAACVSLIEMRVGALPGVASVTVSSTTHRARVAWDAAQASLPDILGAVARAGYRAWPVAAATLSAARKRERRTALWRLFVAGFAMMQVMMYAWPAYVAGAGDMDADIDSLMKIAGFVLTVPVLFYSATPFLKGAWRDLRLRRIGMDVPVAVAILVTFGASAWNTFWASGPVYYDSVTMFVFLMLGGRYLESLARERAAGAVEELTRLQPARAERLDGFPASLEPTDVPAEDLHVGDLVLVRSGAAAPADGVVVQGESLNDEALLTGEGVPVAKGPGARVIGGAINLSAPLVLRVAATGSSSRLSAIVQLMEQAANQKPMLVQLADRYAGAFLGCILLLSVLAGLGWSMVDPSRALWIAVAVLIVTCPCALSLAAPVALSAAVGNLALRGVLATRGHALETLARANHFVFDKTGTLTTGRMQVLDTILLGRLDRTALERLTGQLEQWAVHPVAQALAMAAAPALKRAPAVTVTDYREEHGAGVEARVDGLRVRIGSVAYAQALHGQPLPPQVQASLESRTVAAVADESGWLGVFALGDGVRAQARELMTALTRAGCRVTLLTGDNAQAGARVGAEIGISDVRSSMSPDAKQAFVAGLQREGAVVAMVGDGINDAPVLAQAHVSIAMGSGAPLAQARSDMVLMSAQPVDLWHARQVAVKTLAIVRQNLVWAVAYNLVAIPLAAAGVLNPWIAGIGMSASSLIVVANSLRLLPRKRREHAQPSTPLVIAEAN